MITREKVLAWLLKYCCRHKFYNVVSEILQSNRGLLECPEPHVQLCVSCCMLDRVVVKSQTSMYNIAIQHLNFIHKSCLNTGSFMIYSKLVTGLKQKVLLSMLEEDADGTFSLFCEYFPENGSQFEGVSRTSLIKVHRSEKEFRRFFLPLCNSDRRRLDYFHDEYAEEYGHDFQNALCKLVTLFTGKMYSKLPPCVIDKILYNGTEMFRLLGEDSKAFQILLHALSEKCKHVEGTKKELKEGEVRELVQTLCRLGPGDEGHQTNCTVEGANSPSLFTSESSKEINSLDSSEPRMSCDVTGTVNENISTGEVRPCSPVTFKDSAIKTFSDFNKKRKLFHDPVSNVRVVDMRSGDKGEDFRERGDNSIEMLQNSEDAIIISDKSIKSSSESVSLLKRRNKSPPCLSDSEDGYWVDSQGSRGSDSVEASCPLITTEDEVSGKYIKKDTLLSVRSTVSHTQEGQSHGLGSIEAETNFTKINDLDTSRQFTSQELKSALSNTSITNIDSQDSECCVDLMGIPSNQITKLKCQRSSVASQVVDEDNGDTKASDQHGRSGTESRGHRLSAVEESYGLSSSDVEKYLQEGPEYVGSDQLGKADENMLLIGTTNDGNMLHVAEDSDDEIIPPSCSGELNFWDVFFVDDDTECVDDSKQDPVIVNHAKNKDLKLCIVKLHRNKVLDVDNGEGIFHQMYS